MQMYKQSGKDRWMILLYIGILNLKNIPLVTKTYNYLSQIMTLNNKIIINKYYIYFHCYQKKKTNLSERDRVDQFIVIINMVDIA